MNYEELIETISNIVDNEKIYKNGLTLLYELEDKNHRQMNEQLFYSDKRNVNSKFVDSDEFELGIDGLLVKFIKRK